MGLDAGNEENNKDKKNKEKDKKQKKKRKEGEREGDTGHHTQKKPRKSRFVSGQPTGKPKGGLQRATGVLESLCGGTAAYQTGKSVATDARCQSAASHASTATMCSVTNLMLEMK